MSTVKAFRGFRPSNALVQKVLLKEAFSSYHEIADDFGHFVHSGHVIQDQRPSMYIYHVSEGQVSHTGVWLLTDSRDLRNGVITKHEKIREAHQRSIHGMMADTGLDVNPIVLTYRPDPAIDLLLHQGMRKTPTYDTHNVKVWALQDELVIEKFKTEFAKVERVYLADGHHRAAAFEGLTGTDYFSSVYFSFDQMVVHPYHRVLKRIEPYTEETLVVELSRRFMLIKKSAPVLPSEKGEFGFTCQGAHYALFVRDPFALTMLDCSILQTEVFENLWMVSHGKPDERIGNEGGKDAFARINEMADSGAIEAAFFLHAPLLTEIIEISDKGGYMPAKSTWFEPKMPSGLLIHAFQRS